MRRIHLVVLYGGQSAEHDVSCVTAAHVLAAADPAKYRITPIGISTSGEWALGEATQAALAAGPGALPSRLDPTGPTVTLSDVVGPNSRGGVTADNHTNDLDDVHDEITVVLPLLHGPLGEDGTVQGLCELANAAYVGSGVLGSAVSMDKAMAKQVLAAHGIAQARFRSFGEHELHPGLAAELADDLGLPCFVKPSNMGSSVGVSKAHTVEELVAAIDHALTYDQWIVAEEAIVGREIEVGVLGNTTSPGGPIASVPGEIVPGEEFYSYEDKYVTDGAQLLVPAPLGEAEADEVRELAVRVFKALRAEGLARVDFFYEEGGRGFLVNEINTMPGFTPISMYPKVWQASGLTYPELIDRLVELAIERHHHSRRNTKH